MAALFAAPMLAVVILLAAVSVLVPATASSKERDAIGGNAAPYVVGRE